MAGKTTVLRQQCHVVVEYGPKLGCFPNVTTFVLIMNIELYVKAMEALRSEEGGKGDETE